jgi:hypothetical protein
VYGSWGSTSVQRGDDWVQSNRETNNRTGNTTRVTRTDNGSMVSRNNPGQGGGFVAQGEGGNMYAGRDGNVYRNTDGSWQKYENGNWGNVEKPAGTGERAGAASTAAGNRQGGTTSTNRAGTNRSVDSSTYGQLERDHSARSSGTQRTRDYSTSRSSSRPSGSYRGGGMSRGGGRRR